MDLFVLDQLQLELILHSYTHLNANSSSHVQSIELLCHVRCQFLNLGLNCCTGNKIDEMLKFLKDEGKLLEVNDALK